MKYGKEFLHRGLLFGGFGPIVAGIVYFILYHSLEGVSLNGAEMFTVILSTYLLAFIHAGTSIFPQIEHWSTARSLFVHLLTLYAAYVSCYLLNSWIPFDPTVLLIFSAIFVGLFLVIWLSVFLAVKATCKKINSKLA